MINYKAADSIKGTIEALEVLFEKMADGSVHATDQEQQDTIDFIDKLNADLKTILADGDSNWSKEHACIQ